MVAETGMPKAVEQRLRDAAHKLTGIKMGPDKQALLTSRVLKRMRALHMEDYREYLEKFESDPSEVEHFINAVTTNTTYFFREDEHFPIIAQAVSGWVGKGHKRIRIWCAASSTGQEPYTMALTLWKALEGRSVDLQILATDIDTKVLATAHRGVYPAEQLQKVPASFRDGFEQVDDGFRVIPKVRSMVRFARLNLTQAPYPLRGPLDLIICRNVMIYFDENTRQRMVHEFERLLRPGALLCIGHSESIQGMTRTLRTERPSVFRRQGSP